MLKKLLIVSCIIYLAYSTATAPPASCYLPAAGPAAVIANACSGASCDGTTAAKSVALVADGGTGPGFSQLATSTTFYLSTTAGTSTSVAWFSAVTIFNSVTLAPKNTATLSTLVVITKDTNTVGTAYLDFVGTAGFILSTTPFSLEIRDITLRGGASHTAGLAFVVANIVMPVIFTRVTVNSTYCSPASSTDFSTCLSGAAGTIPQASGNTALTATTATSYDHQLVSYATSITASYTTVTITGGSYSVNPGPDGLVKITGSTTSSSVIIQDAASFSYCKAGAGTKLFTSGTVQVAALSTATFTVRQNDAASSAPKFFYNTGVQLFSFTAAATYVKLQNIIVGYNKATVAPLIQIEGGSKLLIQDNSYFGYNSLDTTLAQKISGCVVYVKDAFIQVLPATATNSITFEYNTGYIGPAIVATHSSTSAIPTADATLYFLAGAVPLSSLTLRNNVASTGDGNSIYWAFPAAINPYYLGQLTATVGTSSTTYAATLISTGVSTSASNFFIVKGDWYSLYTGVSTDYNINTVEGYQVLQGVETKTNVINSLTFALGDIFGNRLSSAVASASYTDYAVLRPNIATYNAVTTANFKVWLLSQADSANKAYSFTVDAATPTNANIVATVAAVDFTKDKGVVASASATQSPMTFDNVAATLKVLKGDSTATPAVAASDIFVNAKVVKTATAAGCATHLMGLNKLPTVTFTAASSTVTNFEYKISSPIVVDSTDTTWYLVVDAGSVLANSATYIRPKNYVKNGANDLYVLPIQFQDSTCQTASQCAAGQSVDPTGACITCDATCQTCSGTTQYQCITCPGGFPAIGKQCKVCTTAGQAVDASGNCVAVSPTAVAATLAASFDKTNADTLSNQVGSAAAQLATVGGTTVPTLSAPCGTPACSGHGKCTYAAMAVPTCTCDPDTYGGALCQYLKTDLTAVATKITAAATSFAAYYVAANIVDANSMLKASQTASGIVAAPDTVTAAAHTSVLNVISGIVGSTTLATVSTPQVKRDLFNTLDNLAKAAATSTDASWTSDASARATALASVRSCVSTVLESHVQSRFASLTAAKGTLDVFASKGTTAAVMAFNTAASATAAPKKVSIGSGATALAIELPTDLLTNLANATAPILSAVSYSFNVFAGASSSALNGSVVNVTVLSGSATAAPTEVTIATTTGVSLTIPKAVGANVQCNYWTGSAWSTQGVTTITGANALTTDATVQCNTTHFSAFGAVQLAAGVNPNSNASSNTTGNNTKPATTNAQNISMVYLYAFVLLGLLALLI